MWPSRWLLKLDKLLREQSGKPSRATKACTIRTSHICRPTWTIAALLRVSPNTSKKKQSIYAVKWSHRWLKKSQEQRTFYFNWRGECLPRIRFIDPVWAPLLAMCMECQKTLTLNKRDSYKFWAGCEALQRSALWWMMIKLPNVCCICV